MARLKVAVLISGRGSNLQSLIDACAAPDFPAQIALVISNRADAQGLARAARAGIAAVLIDHKKFADRAAFDHALDRAIRASGAGLICLAGFMRLLTPGFVAAWRDRMINIHPSLLPAFPGLHTHERALAAGCRFAGCTVHFVRAETDTGPIVAQAAVPIRSDDDADSLAARVLEAEHRIYPLALRWVAEGRVLVEGARATVAGAGAPEGAMVNPAEKQPASVAPLAVSIEHCEAYWRDVVEPDYRDFIAKIDDLRLAFHCAITLFHMADWVYVVHKSYIDSKFKFKDKNGNLQRVTDEKMFANAVQDLYPDFKLIRGIANSAKHLKLKKDRDPHPPSPSHAANTRVQSTGWGKGRFGNGPYGGTPRVMLAGPNGQDLEFSDIATSTYNMWKSLAQDHGWKL